MSIIPINTENKPATKSRALSDQFQLSSDMAWYSDFLGEIPRGTNILLAGDPGAGKSTLAQQLCLSSAKAGEVPVFITTEQSAELVEKRMGGLVVEKGMRKDKLLRSISIVDDLTDLSLLPAFLNRQVFGITGQLRGTTFIVIDSLQGRASPAGERNFYRSIYDVMRMATATGVTVLYLGHFTKGRQIAGPRTLEHQADVSSILRHGINCRAMTVPKNRNGASRTDPFSVVVDERTTRLVPSPLGIHTTAKVHTLSADGLVCLDVAVTLPRSDQGYIKGISRRETETIVDLVARVVPSARMLPSLGVTVRAGDGVRYRRDFSLAVAVGLAFAVDRIDVPDQFLVVGDVDLRGIVLPPSSGTLDVLLQAVSSGEIDRHVVIVTAPGEHAKLISDQGIKVCQVGTVRDALLRMMP